MLRIREYKPRIIACLSWYDEEPELLAEYANKLSPHVDALVSLDGAYRDYPHENYRSPECQSEALKKECNKKNQKHFTHFILKPESGLTQSQKRTKLYNRAAYLFHCNEDWLLILDADERITRFDNDIVREQLTSTACDAASVTLKTGDAVATHTRLIRCQPSIKVGDEYHSMIQATDIHGGTVCINDRRGIIMSQNPRPRKARILDLSEYIVIENHTNNRPKNRLENKKTYIKNRLKTGVDL